MAAKIIGKIKDYLLNRSGQYRFYKSQYVLLTKENSLYQNKIEEFEHQVKESDNNQTLLKKIEEQKSEIDFLKKGGYIKNKGKCLADIRNEHPANSIDNVSVGNYTYGNPVIERFNPYDELVIGKFCSIGKNVTILVGMGHNPQCASTYPFKSFIGARRANYKKTEEKNIQIHRTTIGNDVWIGYDALILPGVTIGDGAVIGARAVVSKDVEPYSVVVGSPLKHLRYRFPKEVRDVLMDVKWWDLPDEKIEELAPYLMDSNIQNFLEKLKLDQDMD